MERYIDTETGEIITREQLEYEWKLLVYSAQDERTFLQYLNDCLDGNGFLEKI